MVGVRFATVSRFLAAVAARIGEEPYTTGEYRNRFIDALLDANSLWYPLRYPGEFRDPSTGTPSTINQQIHYH